MHDIKYERVKPHPLLAATHYVLDLETLGKGPSAAIVAIGCVRVEFGMIGTGFYERVDLASAMAQGGEVDASTTEFWLQQQQEARQEVNGTRPCRPLSEALQMLVEFIAAGRNPANHVRVWGNGATFDNVIVSTALQRAGIERPWAFWNDRDLRTIVELYPEARTEVEFVGVKHHALDDAMHEARILCAAIAQHTNTRFQRSTL